MRLWPVSRSGFAKPFVSLPGQSHPLLAQTYARLCDAPSLAGVITVSSEKDMFLCREFAAVHAPNVPQLFIGEPHARNTAPAIMSAACWAAKRFGEESVMLALPADHAVKNVSAFWAAVNGAVHASLTGKIALLGITPDYPATGYGYIDAGEEDENGVRPVRRFVEKPDSQRAQEFVDSGFLWNAGVFGMQVGELFSQAAKFAPELSVIATQTPPAEGDVWLPESEQYKKFPEISFDYALAEKTDKAAVCAVNEAGWSDVGSWRAVADSLSADAEGNYNTADAVLIDSQNCMTVGGHRAIAAVGVSNLYIIDTPDALLVAADDSGEKTREVVARLREQNRSQADTPVTVRRPWGGYTVLSEGEGYKVKRIDVNPGGLLSLQSHRRRDEYWTAVVGEMTVVLDGREFRLPAGESCHIPVGAKHRMGNNTSAPAAIIEVQTGDYLEEDDIVRYEDIYGRS